MFGSVELMFLFFVYWSYLISLVAYDKQCFWVTYAKENFWNDNMTSKQTQMLVSLENQAWK